MQTWWDEHVGEKAGWGHSPDHPQRVLMRERIGQYSRVLEIGYGTGKDYLPDLEYRGYDLTPSFQRTCQRRFPDGDFRLGDVTDLPELDKSWDVVFSRHLLDHVVEWEAALREMWRIAANELAIGLWQPLSDKPTARTDKGDVCCWRFNRKDWFLALSDLGGYSFSREHNTYFVVRHYDS